MTKELYEMTLAELWELFPIFLIDPTEKWKINYAEIASKILNIIDESEKIRISHIGSTAIKGIMAKNIVDVLVEIPHYRSLTEVAEKLVQNGFIKMSADKNRISLNKGYTKSGFAEKVYHVHIRYMGDNDELYFRDYLNEHADVAKEYEQLKLKLWKRFEHDRDAYTAAKTDFIQHYTNVAKTEYGNKYRSNSNIDT